jgi:transposase
MSWTRSCISPRPAASGDTCRRIFRPIRRCRGISSDGPCGFDAGKKIKGRKRHIVTDTQGHLIGVVIHAADIQDRDGAPLALSSIRSTYPWLRHVFAEGGYAGPKLERALAGQGDWAVEIVNRPNAANGFVLIARRWVVERTFAWLGRCRLAKEFEATIEALSLGSLLPISGA